MYVNVRLRDVELLMQRPLRRIGEIMLFRFLGLKETSGKRSQRKKKRKSKLKNQLEGKNCTIFKKSYSETIVQSKLKSKKKQIQKVRKSRY